MSGFSVTLDNKLLDVVFSGVAFTTPDKYLALFKAESGLTTDDATTWGPNEVPASVTVDSETKTTAYARVKMNNSIFNAAVNSAVTNNANIEFPVAEQDWGEVSHVAIMDAATAGHVLAWGLIRNPVTLAAQPREVLTGDQFIVRTNTMNVRLNDHPTI